MARSYRRTKIFGITGGRASQSAYRSSENRALRRRVHQDLDAGIEELDYDYQYGNEWNSPRDGKQYWHAAKKEDMRK